MQRVRQTLQTAQFFVETQEVRMQTRAEIQMQTLLLHGKTKSSAHQSHGQQT